MPAPNEFHALCAAAGVDLGPRHLAILEEYLQRLLAENQRMNLTAAQTEKDLWIRHIGDCLRPIPLLPETGTALDVGSGGGFPGLPAAMLRPELQVTLLDSTRKKCRFLEQTAAALRLPNVRVHYARAEDAGRDRPLRDSFDCVLARAVAPLRVLLELTVPFAREGGRVLAMKGAKASEEVADAQNAFAELQCSLREDVGAQGDATRILVIGKDAPTPTKYPRKPGIPGKRPL